MSLGYSEVQGQTNIRNDNFLAKVQTISPGRKVQFVLAQTKTKCYRIIGRPFDAYIGFIQKQHC